MQNVLHREMSDGIFKEEKIRAYIRCEEPWPVWRTEGPTVKGNRDMR